MRLYYHKTSGGAEYLTDKYIICPNGDKEGIFEGANYIVRIDGDIEKDAELTVREPVNQGLLEALQNLMGIAELDNIAEAWSEEFEKAQAAIAKAEGRVNHE